MTIKMKIKAVHPLYVPEYKTDGASGADCKSRGDYVIKPGETAKIPLGISCEIPEGYEIQVRPRSGTSLSGMLSPTGTVDADYRGEISIIIHNATTSDAFISDGDRIAQIVCAPVTRVIFLQAKTLSDTERGDGGFGSTGI